MSYPGSKGADGVWQRIIGQMPPHSTYVEPFFGSGQIYWHKKPAAASILIDVAPGLTEAAAAQPGTTALCGNAFELLPQLGLKPGALVYADPPYLLETRKMREYYQPVLIGSELVRRELSREQHIELLRMLDDLDCFVMLSGYPSALYSGLLEHWRLVSYRTRTRGRTLTECLWCNFAEPERLHDWRYAGKNFRQRLRLKRLAARWLARLGKMPARERGFVLDAIQQRHFGSAADDAGGLEKNSREVTARVLNLGSNGHGRFVARAYIGSLPVFETGERDQPMQATLDCQDWASRCGKTVRFEP